MADNAGNPPATTSSSFPPPADSDHVNLQLAYMVTGNPRPTHSLGRISLNTTVASLRDRIQSELPEHPSPQSQRLIYRGHALMRDEATLRQVLRLENGSPSGPLPYTIQIIINSSQPPPPPNGTSQPSVTASLVNVPHPTTSPLPRPASNLSSIAAVHAQAHAQAHAHAHAQAHYAGLQEAISRIQQSIETNGADLRSVQQRIAMQHNDSGSPATTQQNQTRNQAHVEETLPSAAPPPPPAQTVPNLPFQANPQGLLMPHHPPQLPGAIPPNFIPFDLAALLPGAQQGLEPPHQHGTPGLPPAAGGLQAHPLPGQINPTPTAHPPPAGITSSNPQIQTMQGPNGERMTVISDQVTLRIPIQRPASAPGQPPPRNQQNRTPIPTPQSTNLAGRPSPQVQQQPALLPTLPFHLPMPFSSAYTIQPQPSRATAWILSSPTGPQAFLFSPNHGYFSSTAPNSHSTNPVPQQDSATTQASAGGATQATSSAPTVAGNTDAPAQADGNLNQALIRQGPRAGPAVVEAPQNPQDNDLFALIIQRGWLFLRLYLFMFVFSDQGTWKRWLMIVLAAIICLQPRDGPLTRALTAARQYFDNLIGPATPRPQAQAAQRRPDRGGQGAVEEGQTNQRPANVRGAVQMTPEEAAARLIREHQNQNPSIWRDAFHRVEQSLALFLASLIPGVGERHVRAREEARRLAQQLEEEERQRAEDAAAAAAQPADGHSAPSDEPPNANVTNSEPKVQVPNEPGTSSGVEIREATAEAGELRNRPT